MVHRLSSRAVPDIPDSGFVWFMCAQTRKLERNRGKEFFRGSS